MARVTANSAPVVGLWLACGFVAVAGCSRCDGASGTGTAPVAGTTGVGPATSSSSSSATGQAPAPKKAAVPARREGSVIALAAGGDALYVADEDHQVLRVVPLPLDPARPGKAVALPGAPAQVLVV